MQVEKNPLSAEVTRIIEGATKQIVLSAATLAGGRANAKLVVLSGGRQVVVKLPKGKDGTLAVEGAVIDYLKKKTKLPMPTVYYAGNDALIHDYIVADGVLTPEAEPEAAALLADLHTITADSYGFDFDTLFKDRLQKNDKNARWVPFFVENRLLAAARQALDAGKTDVSVFGKIEKLAQNLDRYLDEPEKPSLIHGDIWSSSVLCRNGHVQAFVDPAIYFADSEMEFAFLTPQSGLSAAFFRAYNEIRPFRAGYFEYRQKIYSLYPLLTALASGDSSVMPQLEEILNRFGE